MSTRKTSAAVFYEIEANGLLSAKRFEIYKILFIHGPLTAAEVAREMRGEKSASVGANVHARLCELRRMLAVEELGERQCRITGNNVILWDVTDKIPKKIEKEKMIACPHCGGLGKISTERSRGDG